jgi:hypothetical protein
MSDAWTPLYFRVEQRKRSAFGLFIHWRTVAASSRAQSPAPTPPPRSGACPCHRVLTYHVLLRGFPTRRALGVFAPEQSAHRRPLRGHALRVQFESPGWDLVPDLGDDPRRRLPAMLPRRGPAAEGQRGGPSAHRGHVRLGGGRERRRVRRCRPAGEYSRTPTRFPSPSLEGPFRG